MVPSISGYMLKNSRKSENEKPFEWVKYREGEKKQWKLLKDHNKEDPAEMHQALFDTPERPESLACSLQQDRCSSSPSSPAAGNWTTEFRTSSSDTSQFKFEKLDHADPIRMWHLSQRQNKKLLIPPGKIRLLLLVAHPSAFNTDRSPLLGGRSGALHFHWDLLYVSEKRQEILKENGSCRAQLNFVGWHDWRPPQQFQSATPLWHNWLLLWLFLERNHGI